MFTDNCGVVYASVPTMGEYLIDRYEKEKECSIEHPPPIEPRSFVIYPAKNNPAPPFLTINMKMPHAEGS